MKRLSGGAEVLLSRLRELRSAVETLIARISEAIDASGRGECRPVGALRCEASSVKLLSWVRVAAED